MLLAAFLASQPLVFIQHVELDGSEVRLSDVADLSGLPPALKQRATGLVVAHVEAGRSVLSSRRVAARSRALLPGLSAWLPDGDDTPIHVVSLATDPVTSAAASGQTPRIAATPRFVTGETVTISTQVGPVAVEREVRALQDGWPGRSVFVRTGDGRVLTASIASAP